MVVDSVGTTVKSVVVQYPSQNQQSTLPKGATTGAYNSPYDPYRDYKANTPPANEKAGGVVSKETSAPAADAPAEKKRVRIGAGWSGRSANEAAGEKAADDSFRGSEDAEYGYGYGYHGYPGYAGYSDEYVGGR